MQKSTQTEKIYGDLWRFRGRPFLHMGFTILSTKAFRWVGGSEEGAQKNYKCGKTHPLKIKLFFHSFPIRLVSFWIFVTERQRCP